MFKLIKLVFVDCTLILNWTSVSVTRFFSKTVGPWYLCVPSLSSFNRFGNQDANCWCSERFLWASADGEIRTFLEAVCTVYVLTCIIQHLVKHVESLLLEAVHSSALLCSKKIKIQTWNVIVVINGTSFFQIKYGGKIWTHKLIKGINYWISLYK